LTDHASVTPDVKLVRDRKQWFCSTYGFRDQHAARSSHC
jgi:hypothetical protein